MDQSDAGSAGIFSRWTNQPQEARTQEAREIIGRFSSSTTKVQRTSCVVCILQGRHNAPTAPTPGGTGSGAPFIRPVYLPRAKIRVNATCIRGGGGRFSHPRIVQAAAAAQ
eukprot:1195394-Prorocentrum_minimum.AAC.4